MRRLINKTSKIRLVIIIFIIIPIINLNAQDDTEGELDKKKSLQICITDALFEHFNVTFTSFYRKNRAFELMVGYNGNSILKKVVPLGNDPAWYYNKITVRSGLRLYNNKRLYFSPLITASYGFYDKILFTDYDGYKNNDALISRTKTAMGCVVKFGITSIKKRFILDFYTGFGYNISCINEEIIYQGRSQNDLINNKSYWKNQPSVHLGLLIGIILK